MKAFTIGGYSRPSKGYFGPQLALVTGIEGAVEFLKTKELEEPGKYPPSTMPKEDIIKRFMSSSNVEDENIDRVIDGRIFTKR